MLSCELIDRLDWISVELYKVRERIEDETEQENLRNISNDLNEIMLGVKAEIK